MKSRFDFGDMALRGEILQHAIEGTRMPMLISNPNAPDNPIIFANPAFLKLTGYTEDEVIAANCRFLQGPDTDPASVSRLRRGVSRSEDVTVTLLNYRKDRTPFWNELYISPVFDKSGALLCYFGSQLDVTHRIEAQRRLEREVAARTRDLEEMLKGRETLLHELQHRVKNNLQVVSSIINLQTREFTDPTVRHRFETLGQRVKALELVYRQLYSEINASTLDLRSYLADVIGNIVAFHDAAGRIEIQTDLHACRVPLETALPLGLMINEMITNSFKHAFGDDGHGVIRVSLRPLPEEGRWCVTVADDGVGLSPAVRQGPGRSLGMQLIDALSGQIGATVTRTSGTGATFHITFQAGEGRTAIAPPAA